MKKSVMLVGLALICVFLLGTKSWGYSYRCEILKIVHRADGAVVHVAPGLGETGFTEESRVFFSSDAKSRGMFDMLLSAASANMEIVASTTAPISWIPRLVNRLTIIASDSESSEQRGVDYHGPVSLTSYTADNNGSYYFVSDPSQLPENAVAVRVPTHEATLAALMTTAYMNGKSVLVAVSNRWWLGQDQLAWTIYSAKIE